MTENAVVRARIDARTKDDAAAVLAGMGLTVSDAFRMMMTRIAVEKTLPFEAITPNAETIAAMRAARAGETVKATSPEDLLDRLNAPD